ncbi:MAG: rod shape-determining protein MreD [Candidatus Alcyoniella australis]|nr:rod shape-determining protein MreD [Candidatus Alcyoniella australis]
MIKALSFLTVGVLAVWLQSMLWQHLPIFGVAPDLALICVIYMGIFRNPIWGGLIAFCLGYVVDLFSGQVFGQYVLVFVLIFYAMRVLGKLFYMRSLSFQLVSVLLITLLAKLLAALVMIYVVPTGSDLLALVDLKLLLPQIGLNLVFAPLMFKVLFRLEKITTSGYFDRRAAGWF